MVTPKQLVGNLPTNCLSVFDDPVKLALKGLNKLLINKTLLKNFKKNEISKKHYWKNNIWYIFQSSCKYKSNKSHEVKFIIALSKSPEP